VMDSYLGRDDWRVNENSSVDYSLGGLILHNSGSITANYWLENIYPKIVSDAHKNGDIHIHNLQIFASYCCGWSLRQLIMEGLGGVSGKISSKPAKHLSTLINQMVNFLGTLQNEWAGAQAFSSIDTFLAPYIREDNLTYSEVKQNIQSFVFGLNVSSRWGSQPIFSNLTFDWVVPQDLRDQPVIVGDKVLDNLYSDYQNEMDMVNKAFLEVMIEGDAEKRGFSYPIPTYNLTKNFDWDNKNCDLLFKLTAKYGTPYFQNFINSDLDPSAVRAMCCHLSLDKRELKKRGGGLFGCDEMTGSLSVITLNMGRIGYLSNTKEEYFSMLDKYMDIAYNASEIKRKILKKLLNGGLYPYTRRYLRNFDNYFSTIGLIGMNESMLNFLGKDMFNQDSIDFSIEVLDHMKSKLLQYQEISGNLYNLEATPGEGTSYRLAKIDKAKYPDIVLSGDGDPYYTNSTQLPVGITDDIFEALELQNNIQKMYTGGTVFHGFLDTAVSDSNTCRSLVRKIAENFEIPYFTITPTYSICKNHGYLNGEQFNCPTCNEATEVYSRIVGYYRPIQNWNRGKKSEYKERKLYSISNKGCII
jgi:anaerobic ribonucleoside-triphosphate reductase